MKAMILAAGLGARMGELTRTTPKPLLQLKGNALIEYPIRNLAAIGVQEIMINTYYLAEQIEQYLGNGSRYDIHLHYSREETLLGTAGGIYRVLNFFGDDPFIVISADIYTDYPLAQLHCPQHSLAHLVLAPNPEFKRQGDYGLDERGHVNLQKPTPYTYASFGMVRPELFASCQQTPERELAPLFEKAMKQNALTGEVYHGFWDNIGTPQQLTRLNSGD